MAQLYLLSALVSVLVAVSTSCLSALSELGYVELSSLGEALVTYLAK